ncbi:hypothetical protein H072_7876 [Dactylellina haptotyla CBS 200.50]|uniref:Uncharacterized protein n=1 Tax=Dactylellina haptotyla (strain CBS 200.50) TaxID=1284197 RepID=S8A5X4_DACHA|nr:hypothetical protein H072_7876 [Dactylellina haptotyla CBS 200.50]
MQPHVDEDDPVSLRKNPTRNHQEFLCYWRSQDGFKPQTIYNHLTSYLHQYGTTVCSGPGGFCTMVWCKDNYFISVCNWSDKPWQVMCQDIIRQARDLVVAVNNENEKSWEIQDISHGQGDDVLGAGSKERQIANDRKKICQASQAVYHPNMIGLTFFNANPYFQVQLYYQFPSEQIVCPIGEGDHRDGANPGSIYPEVQGNAKSQDEYLEKWYNIPSEKTLTGEDGEGSGKAAPGLRGNKTKTGGSKSNNLPLPQDYSIPGYRGPNLKDYDPAQFMPPAQAAQWKHEQMLKSLGLTTVKTEKTKASKGANTSATQGPSLRKFPSWYTKTFSYARPSYSWAPDWTVNTEKPTGGSGNTIAKSTGVTTAPRETKTPDPSPSSDDIVAAANIASETTTSEVRATDGATETSKQSTPAVTSAPTSNGNDVNKSTSVETRETAKPNTGIDGEKTVKESRESDAVDKSTLAKTAVAEDKTVDPTGTSIIDSKSAVLTTTSAVSTEPPSSASRKPTSSAS